MNTARSIAHVCTKDHGCALNHGELHEALKASTVGIPVLSSGKGLSAIVVKVNALQVVITAVADVNSICCSQGLLQRESTGASLVINPVVALPSNGLVVAIQRQIATIAQALQAIGQQSAANGVRHSESPTQLKAAILLGHAGSGKSQIAQGLAPALALHQIVEEWNPASALTLGALHVTNAMPSDIAPDVAVIQLL